MEEKKKRGRPKKTPSEETKPAPHKGGISSTKEGGYAAQKRYRANHPERVLEQDRKRRARFYEVKIRFLRENEPIVKSLLEQTGLSLTQLCINAIEEKYDVVLAKNG